MFEKTENKRKRGRGWPIFKKKYRVILPQMTVVNYPLEFVSWIRALLCFCINSSLLIWRLIKRLKSCKQSVHYTLLMLPTMGKSFAVLVPGGCRGLVSSKTASLTTLTSLPLLPTLTSNAWPPNWATLATKTFAFRIRRSSRRRKIRTPERSPEVTVTFWRRWWSRSRASSPVCYLLRRQISVRNSVHWIRWAQNKLFCLGKFYHFLEIS